MAIQQRSKPFGTHLHLQVNSSDKCTHLICVHKPSSGGTCPILLFCRSRVARADKFFTPSASIVSTLLSLANIISSFGKLYNTDGSFVNLKCNKKYILLRSGRMKHLAPNKEGAGGGHKTCLE